MDLGLKLSLGVRVGGASATANFSSTSGYAPLGLIVEVEGLSAFDYQYVWDFDDTGEWTALSSDNMFGRAKGTAYGPCACHTFESAGTYTVTCTVKSSDGTEVGSFSQDITVTDPDAAFPGTQTICIDAGGTYAGAPTGSDNYTSIAAAIASTTLDNKRLLLNAGDTYSLNDFSSRINDTYVGRYGTGADPIITCNYNSTRTNFDWAGGGTLSNMVITNINFQGDYDANLSGGNGGLNPHDIEAISLTRTGSATKTVTIHSCTFSGVKTAIIGWFDIGENTTIVISNNTIREWANYGVYYDKQGDIGFVGNSIKQEIDAVNGGDGKQFAAVPQYPDHGPIRVMGDATIICPIHQNELFNNCGWSVLGAKTAHQPCIRYNASGTDGWRGVIERNVMEGGGTILSAAATTAATFCGLSDYLIIEKNYMIGTAGSYQPIELGHGNTDFRNNIIVRPQVDFEVQSNTANIAFRQTDSTAYAGAMRIRNNTFIDLRDFAGSAFDVVGADPGYATFVEDNNIEYYPNVATSPSSAAEPFEQSPAIYTPRYDGERFETTTPNTTYATPASTAKTFRHGPSSPAEDAATANYPPDDFEGNLRGTGNTSDGAYHTDYVKTWKATASGDQLQLLTSAAVSGKQKLTLIVAYELTGTAPSNGNIFMGAAGFQSPVQVYTTNTLRLTVEDSTPSDVVTNQNIASAGEEAGKYALMISIDFDPNNDATYTDGRIDVYMNGSSTTALTGLTTSGSLRANPMGVISGGDIRTVLQHSYIAIYDGWLDPATYFSTFFVSDGSGGYDPTYERGTVNSIDPITVVGNTAAEINANTPLVGTITTVGTFVDV